MSLVTKPRARRAQRKPSKPVMRALQAGAPSNGAEVPSAPFPVLAPALPQFPRRALNLQSFITDPTDCTAAFASAIRECSESGGGRVLVPAGTWSTGPIHLKSNVELHLHERAIIRFSADPQKYLPPVFVRWGGIECYNYSPLIYARGCKNIAITGHGKLRGQGKPWWTWAKVQQRVTGKLHQMVLQGTPVEERRLCTDLLPLRPQFIMPIDCENVLLEDFTIDEGGPLWNVHVAYCRNVTIRRLTIRTPDGPNNDGIDIDSSSNVLVEDCLLHTSDDCISLKSGMNEDGWRVDRPAESIVIRRVRATRGQGGIAIGSEMSGGVRNVLVEDCTYDGVTTGIRMKAARGRGGVVENVHIRNISMGRVTGDAIQVTTEHSTFVARDGRAPTFRNIHIRDVTCDHSKTAVRMIGLPDRALQNIKLENVTIACDEGLHCAAVNLFHLVNVRITPRTGPVLSVKDGQEVVIHGLNDNDAGGVFLDLRGRQTKNIRLRGEPNNRTRPSVVLGIDVPRDALVHE